MRLCKYLNQRVNRIGKLNEKLLRVFQKQKRKKSHEEIEFHNSIQD